MATGKTTRIAAIALLLLALGLAWRLVPRADQMTAGNQPEAANHPTVETHPDPRTPGVDESPGAHEPAKTTTKADTAPQTKLSERKESMSIRDLEKYGIKVEAEHVGKNSASGKVRISTKEGAVLEADRAKMSPGGMLVAEGNLSAVHGETRMSVAGENGAMAIYFDEKTQHVTVRANSAEGITVEPDPNDPKVIDPDRSGVK